MASECLTHWTTWAGLGSVTARHSSGGRQPNFAALNRGRHLYSAGQPSRWALAHILVVYGSETASMPAADITLPEVARGTVEIISEVVEPHVP